MGLIALVDEELGITLAPDTILNCETIGDLLSEVGLTPRGASTRAA